MARTPSSQPPQKENPNPLDDYELEISTHFLEQQGKNYSSIKSHYEEIRKAFLNLIGLIFALIILLYSIASTSTDIYLILGVFVYWIIGLRIFVNLIQNIPEEGFDLNEMKDNYNHYLSQNIYEESKEKIAHTHLNYRMAKNLQESTIKLEQKNKKINTWLRYYIWIIAGSFLCLILYKILQTLDLDVIYKLLRTPF